MKNVLVAIVVLLAASAMGQYTTTHVGYPVDITSNTTSGTNAWKYMPGNPVCLSAPGSIAAGGDLSIWCVGTDHHVYKYDMKTYQWDQQTAMGTSVVALAVRSANEVYGLMPGNCSGGPGVFHWTGTSWEGPNGCLVQLSVAWDGVLTGVNNAHNKFTAPYTSNFGSRQWNDDGGSWNFSSEWGGGLSCAITSGGQVNVITPSASPKAMPSIPSGAAVGCVLFYDDTGSQLMAWNSAGTDYLIDLSPAASGWSTVAGPPITQIGGYQKAWLLGVDTTGKPYHWNVYAKYIAATTSGTFTQCPGIPQIECHQNTPIHAGHLQTYFTSGHGLNYNAGMQSTLVAPQSQMNLTSWDINPQCDPLLGHPDDPECTSNTYGSEHCNQANADLPNNPTQAPDPSEGESIAVSGFVNTIGYGGPYLTNWSTPNDGAWYGVVRRNYYDACSLVGVSEPTCPIDYSAPFNKVILQAYHSQVDSEFAEIDVRNMMEVAIMGADMPVVIWEPYTKVNGVAQCTGQTRETESFGFLPAIPACQ